MKKDYAWQVTVENELPPTWDADHRPPATVCWIVIAPTVKVVCRIVSQHTKKEILKVQRLECDAVLWD